MEKVEKSISIQAPVEEVFAYLRDPMSNVEWLPGMVEVNQVSGEGVGAKFRWVYRMAGMNFEGESITLEFVENARFVTESHGGIASTWTWAFAPENGGTKIDLTVEYTVPIPVLGKLAEALVVRQNEKDLDKALAKIKARMEG
jgi:carbon monoxide dehydrogenase subunit G